MFTINLFGSKITFLIGPEVSVHFFQGAESEISQGEFYEFTVPMFGQEVGHGVDFATRNEQNSFCIDALKTSKLRSYVDPMLQEVEVLPAMNRTSALLDSYIYTLNLMSSNLQCDNVFMFPLDYFEKWGQEGIIDLKHELDQVLMLISGRCLLGKEIREKMLDEFYTLFHEIENSLSLINFFLPYIPIPANRRRDAARIKLKEILSETVRSRKRYNQVEEDALQNLIDSKYKDGRSISEDEVTGLMIGLIFAGEHTNSLSSAWTGSYLLNDAKCLMTAIEEQKKIIKKFGRRIDYHVLLEMYTLDRCIKEALRLHPTAPMLLRKVHKHFTVWTKEGHEYEIPAGHTIVSPTVLNHYIPYIYKDPEVYDPERFGPGREEDKVGGKFSYTSFSGGRHACPGEAYGYMQMKVIWSYLLRNYELKLLSPFPKEEWRKFALKPQGKVMVSYKIRQLA